MRHLVIAACAMAFAAPASANVASTSEIGFAVREAADVDASAEESWALLIKPAAWWNPSHTYSGDAANLSLDAMAAGCFCEVLPSTASARAAPRGSVEHMRTVYAEQPRVLRLSGALGPLQADAVQGTLTIALKPLDGGGTRIMWEYVVGGYMRQKPAEIAPAVDAMLADQLARLAAKLGARKAVAAEPPAQVRKPAEGR